MATESVNLVISTGSIFCSKAKESHTNRNGQILPSKGRSIIRSTARIKDESDSASFHFPNIEFNRVTAT